MDPDSPLHAFNTIFNTVSNVMHTQVTESLSDTFKSEKQVLDTTATIELNADPFPYEVVFNWVHTLNYLISSYEIKFHVNSGERLSDYYNQYKSSIICLSGLV